VLGGGRGVLSLGLVEVQGHVNRLAVPTHTDQSTITTRHRGKELDLLVVEDSDFIGADEFGHVGCRVYAGDMNIETERD
jgi:hypothetical protein